MTPGSIGKPWEPPPVGKRRVAPPWSIVAVAPPGSVITPPSAAVALPPAVSDRLHSIDTSLINADEIGLCYGRQSPRRLGQEQASGNTRCCKKGQLLMTEHFQVLSVWQSIGGLELVGGLQRSLAGWTVLRGSIPAVRSQQKEMPPKCRRINASATGSFLGAITDTFLCLHVPPKP
jgi:hypothetical protein